MTREPKTTEAHRERARRYYWENREKVLAQAVKRNWLKRKAKR